MEQGIEHKLMNTPEHLLNHPDIDEGKDWDAVERKQEEDANADYGDEDFEPETI